MADSSRRSARATTRLLALVVGLLFAVLLLIIVFRGCHEGDLGEDEVRPGDPLPGTQETTGQRFVPDAVPLLAALPGGIAFA